MLELSEKERNIVENLKGLEAEDKILALEMVAKLQGNEEQKSFLLMLAEKLKSAENP